MYIFFTLTFTAKANSTFFLNMFQAIINDQENNSIIRIYDPTKIMEGASNMDKFKGDLRSIFLYSTLGFGPLLMHYLVLSLLLSLTALIVGGNRLVLGPRDPFCLLA